MIGDKRVGLAVADEVPSILKRCPEIPDGGCNETSSQEGIFPAAFIAM